MVLTFCEYQSLLRNRKMRMRTCRGRRKRAVRRSLGRCRGERWNGCTPRRHGSAAPTAPTIRWGENGPAVFQGSQPRDAGIIRAQLTERPHWNSSSSGVAHISSLCVAAALRNRALSVGVNKTAVRHHKTHLANISYMHITTPSFSVIERVRLLRRTRVRTASPEQKLLRLDTGPHTSSR